MSRKDKMYNMKDEGINTLVGRKIHSAKIDDEKQLVAISTDKGMLYLSWVGECCAVCYLAHVSGIDSLIGSTIISAENSEWKREVGGGYEVIESMGTNIKTDKGYVTFETRLDHSGYYSGSLLVSSHKFIGQYRFPYFRDIDSMNNTISKMKQLVDF